MKQLFCPWRNDYTTSIAEKKQDGCSKTDCVFCTQPQEDNDAHYFILARYKHCYVMLNRYPYNAGHILIIPHNHVPNLEDLTPEAQTEMMNLCAQSSAILKSELKAEGINIGINMGKAAGAGIPSHLHMHVLPRWQGDTNFFPTLCDTKQISFDLHEIYKELKQHFE